MAQNTNAAAFIRLQPLQNNNIGAVVEEHLRYWGKVKSEDEAKELARRAAAEKSLAAARKERASNIPIISAGDKVGYFQNGLVEAFEAAQDDIAWNAEMYKNTGDSRYLQKLNTYKREFEAGSTLVGTFTEKTKQLFDPKFFEDNYNPYLDEEKRTIMEHLANSNYVMKGRTVSIPDFENPDELKAYTYEELSGFINDTNWSGNPDFGKTGSEIAGRIKLNDVNGNRQLTQSKELAGINYWKDRLLRNSVELATLSRIEGVEPESEDGEFTPNQINKLAKKAFDDYTLGGISEVDRGLDNEGKRLVNQGRIDSLRAGRAVFTLSTDEEGERIKRAEWQGQGISVGENERILSTRQNIKTDDNIIVTDILYGEQGNVAVIGQRPVKNRRNMIGEDGEVITDQYGDPRTEVYETFEDVRIDDNRKVNNVIKNSWNPETQDFFKDLGEFRQYAEKIAPTVGGVDEYGVPIQN